MRNMRTVLKTNWCSSVFTSHHIDGQFRGKVTLQSVSEKVIKRKLCCNLINLGGNSGQEIYVAIFHNK